MRSRGRPSRRASVLVAVIVGIAATLATVPTAVGQELPTGEESNREPRDNIVISKNHEFNPANGVRSGAGTRRDPFVISGWQVDQVVIHDTSAPVVIRNNDIGLLIMNWTGGYARIVDNNIRDLRVNQNVERTGKPTSGLIARNAFGVVGQLRHFDGVFAHNVVGDEDDIELFGPQRAVNFDGFNGAHFQHNIIYGYMDATLHGHHHSSGFHKSSHNHSKPPEPKKHDHGRDAKKDAPKESEEPEHIKSGIHGQRYHRVVISGNKIVSDGPWALRYTDTNHSANDRTAASETDERLNGMHVHHTRVSIRHNKLYGSGLFVDIFNAEDDHHKRLAEGLVQIAGNRISLDGGMTEWESYSGIHVERAQAVQLEIKKNLVETTPGTTEPITGRGSQDAGIWMNELNRGHIVLAGNEVKDTVYGIRASNFSRSVHWWVRGLKTTNVKHPVYYDNTVANHPHKP